MDPEVSLLCPEQPNTCPNPKPAEPSQPVNTIPFYILKIYFNIILHLFLGLQSVLFSPGFTTKTLCMLLFSPIHATYPAHLILLDLLTLLTYTWGGVKIMKLLSIQFSPFLCYFLPLRPTHILQHPVLTHT